jgi:hypothetical protein
MKRQTLPWMLSMFLVASAGSFGCDDGDTPTTKDGGSTGGAGGAKGDAAAGGGTGGSAAGGTGGVAAGGAGGALGGAGGGLGGGGGSAAGGADAGPDTAAGGAGGALPADGGTDAVVDMAATDTAADMAPPVDTAPPGSMVNITQCAQILCPDFFAITNACSGLDDNAWVKQAITGGNNVCASPSGTKRKVTGADMIEAHTTTVVVSKADNTPCYTMELKTDPTVDNIEHWIFKKPDGTQFATGGYIETATNGYKIYLVCGGVRYNVMDGRSCAGFEGDTSQAASATTGTCAIP